MGLTHTPPPTSTLPFFPPPNPAPPAPWPLPAAGGRPGGRAGPWLSGRRREAGELLGQAAAPSHPPAGGASLLRLPAGGREGAAKGFLNLWEGNRRMPLLIRPLPSPSRMSEQKPNEDGDRNKRPASPAVQTRRHLRGDHGLPCL